jgi:hypothetical protein
VLLALLCLLPFRHLLLLARVFLRQLLSLLLMLRLDLPLALLTLRLGRLLLRLPLLGELCSLLFSTGTLGSLVRVALPRLLLLL